MKKSPSRKNIILSWSFQTHYERRSEWKNLRVGKTSSLAEVFKPITKSQSEKISESKNIILSWSFQTHYERRSEWKKLKFSNPLRKVRVKKSPSRKNIILSWSFQTHYESEKISESKKHLSWSFQTHYERKSEWKNLRVGKTSSLAEVFKPITKEGQSEKISESKKHHP